VVNLSGMTVEYLVGPGSASAVPGCFYILDVSAGDLTLTLPFASECPGDAVIGWKRVSPNGGGHSVIVNPRSGESLNGTAGIRTSQAGWGRIAIPRACEGPAAGEGWMSY
jgi:hypothetical protein